MKMETPRASRKMLVKIRAKAIIATASKKSRAVARSAVVLISSFFANMVSLPASSRPGRRWIAGVYRRRSSTSFSAV